MMQLGKALKNVPSGSQSYYPDGVQEDSQYMGADFDNFIKSLENFKNNYVADPSNVMGPMVDELKDRVKEVKKLHEDKTNDPMELLLGKFPPFTFTRDNRWIEVDPFPGPFSPPLPWSPSQRPTFRTASAPLPDVTGRQPDSSTPVAYPRLSTRVVDADSTRDDLRNQPANSVQATPLLGIYSGKPMKQWIVPPPIWGRR